MRNELSLIGLLVTGLIAASASAQSSPPLSSLCDLQTKVVQGVHEKVRLEGVFLPGLEGQGGLVNAGCSGRSTRIEFALKTRDNWEKLEQMSDKLDEVLVVLEGEFYGPPAPDPNLPEAIRKNYHPGWDYNSMTKLVVEAIQNVEPVPANNPCASSPAQKWPCFQHDPTSHQEGTSNPSTADPSQQVPLLQEAALPVYPPIGRAARISGKVVVEVTVSGGKVTATEVKSGPRLLTGGTVANLQTWRFASDVNGKFTVTYTYAMSTEETDSPTNPTVEMLPSLDVKIMAHPVKPIPMYSAPGRPATDTSLHEPGHVLAADKQ